MKQEDITNAIGRNRSTTRGKGRVSRRTIESDPVAGTPAPRKSNAKKPVVTTATAKKAKKKPPMKSMKRSTTTVNLYEYQVQEIDKITDQLKELGWGRAARIHFMRSSIAVMLDKIKPADIDEIIRSETDLEAYMRRKVFT